LGEALIQLFTKFMSWVNLLADLKNIAVCQDWDRKDFNFQVFQIFKYFKYLEYILQHVQWASKHCCFQVIWIMNNWYTMRNREIRTFWVFSIIWECRRFIIWVSGPYFFIRQDQLAAANEGRPNTILYRAACKK
jgi:hypothetical protein